MTNEATLSNYEKIISDQTEIIKGYEKLIKSLPPVSPTVLVNGLIVEAQALMKQPEQKPKDERERRQLFGARMKMIRQMLGLKQADIAKKLNITIQSVKNYESGIREPSIKNLIELAHILNVTTDWLLDVPPPLIEEKPFTAWEKNSRGFLLPIIWPIPLASTPKENQALEKESFAMLKKFFQTLQESIMHKPL